MFKEKSLIDLSSFLIKTAIRKRMGIKLTGLANGKFNKLSTKNDTIESKKGEIKIKSNFDLFLKNDFENQKKNNNKYQIMSNHSYNTCLS